jgi:hypothetical protein
VSDFVLGARGDVGVPGASLINSSGTRNPCNVSSWKKYYYIESEFRFRASEQTKAQPERMRAKKLIPKDRKPYVTES